MRYQTLAGYATELSPNFPRRREESTCRRCLLAINRDMVGISAGPNQANRQILRGAFSSAADAEHASPLTRDCFQDGMDN